MWTAKLIRREWAVEAVGEMNKRSLRRQWPSDVHFARPRL